VVQIEAIERNNEALRYIIQQQLETIADLKTENKKLKDDIYWLNERISRARVPLDPKLMPDFTKEDQYECECAKCHERYLGHKRSILCPKCKLESD
jgi:hypothetical protein